MPPQIKIVTSEGWALEFALYGSETHKVVLDLMQLFAGSYNPVCEVWSGGGHGIALHWKRDNNIEISKYCKTLLTDYTNTNNDFIQFCKIRIELKLK